jgi:xyloglucan-specific exo-beta-1,4-glucanase
MNSKLVSIRIATWFCLLLLPFSLAEIKGQTYGTLPMGGCGFVSGIITCKTEKDLIYVRTDVGGAYRWDTVGQVWIPLLDWVSSGETGYLGVESMAIDPNNPSRLYMSVGISYFNNGKSAILRSSDKGKTFSITDVTSLFKIHGNGMGRNTGEKLAVDPNLGSRLFCGSRSNGLFTSTDSGAHWSRVSSLNITSTTSGNGISFVIPDPSSGTSGSATQTLIVGVSRTGENLYRSDDGGISFSPLSGSPATLMPMRAALASNNSMYITYANASGPWDPNTGQIWKYNLTTGAWTNITPAGYNTPFCGVSVDPNDPERVVASTINIYRSQPPTDGDRFFLTTNGGASWIDLVSRGFRYDPNGVLWNDFGKIHWAGSIEFDPFNTKRAFVVSGNGLFNTENIDSTINVWKFNYKGIEESVPLDMLSINNGPNIFVIGDYDGSRNTDITQYGPQLRPSMGTTNSVAYAALNPKVVARVGSSMYLSSDTGKTWTLRSSIGSRGYVSISADGSTILHTPENSGNTYRSVDNGISWMKVNGVKYTGAKTVADGVNPSVFYIYNNNDGKIRTSLNGGATFFVTGAPGAGGSKIIRTVPGKEGHLWVALYNGGLTRSMNFGSTFTKVSSVTACSAVGIGQAAPGASYPAVYIWGTVDGNEGLYLSADEGATWNRINDSEHEWGGPGNGQFVVGDMNDPGRAFMSTAGRGVVYARADYLLSSSSLTVPVGSSTQITPWVFNGSIVEWTWNSGDTNIAKVDTTGQVTGVAVGLTTITATTGGGKSVKISVHVATPVTDLSVSPALDSIPVGAEIQLIATITPVDATNQTIAWVSVDPSVANVNPSGLVKGIKTGRTIISVIAGNSKKVDIPVIVGIPVNGISINPPSDTIRILETSQLIATITPSNTTDNKKVTWSSDKPDVATVDTTGLVAGISKGSAVITATSQDGSIQTTCKITVINATAINNTTQPGDISIYPNPLNGNLLSIDVGNFIGTTNIKVLNINGETVLERTAMNQQVFELDVSFRPGIYLIQFQNNNERVVKKLIMNN